MNYTNITSESLFVGGPLTEIPAGQTVELTQLQVMSPQGRFAIKQGLLVPA